MSHTAQVAVLGPGRVGRRAERVTRGSGGSLLTFVAFGLLGGYGVLRWATMLAHPPTGRLLGMLGLAVAIAGLGMVAHVAPPRIRAVATAAIVLAALAMIPMAGFPLHWALHLKLAKLTRSIGEGLSALPSVIVPYSGAGRATQAIIVLGAGMLLLGGALTLATSRRPLGEVRLAGAALPMVVLAIVPSALSRPQVAYLHGALLFVLLSAFVFSERVARRRAIGTSLTIIAAVVGGMVLSPVIEGRTPWVSFETLAGTIGGASKTEAFNWAQTYGPLNWPHTGGTVLDVQAKFPYYWKAEDLDMFNGQAWVAAPVGAGDPMAGVTEANFERYSQLLTVSLRGMQTTDVIAAGTASQPDLGANSALQAGAGPGTWVAETPIPAGVSYQVRVYTPDPSGTQLAATGDDYPVVGVAPELTLNLTQGGGKSGYPATLPADEYQFAPYGSGRPLQQVPSPTASSATSRLEDSAYGPAYALAQRLKAGTTTPYQYVQAVMAYLSHGYTYDQQVPATRLPLLTFLFGNHRGYCQQFAGAMALLLRMGGVPARVADGFATGTVDPGDHLYVVSDIDAHAWVEAFFPGYGWIKFDPTPSQDPALSGLASTATNAIKPGAADRHVTAPKHRDIPAGPVPSASSHRGGSGSASPWLTIGIIGLAGFLASAALLLRLARGRARTPEELACELERAFARCGRPLPPGVTLAGVEERLRDAPAAAGYVQTIRRARYSQDGLAPTPAQRRAMRARLGRGLGAFGRIRALIALPPRPGRGLHSTGDG